MNTRYQRQVKIIRSARNAMGYSQQQVATIIGDHVRQYQRIECGERDIRYASMKLGFVGAPVGKKFRKIYFEIPPKVEYSLTERGHSLMKVLDQLCTWEKDNRIDHE